MTKIFILIANLFILMNIAVAANPVEQIDFRISTQQTSQLPRIVVSNDGSQYSRVQTTDINIPVNFSARCSQQRELMRAFIGLGKFNLLSGQMDDPQKIFYQEIAGRRQSNMPVQSYNFRAKVSRMHFSASTSPAKSCNAYMQQKISQGVSKADFMREDRKMRMTFTISFAAECKTKWKASGKWRQISKPAHAVVICRGR